VEKQALSAPFTCTAMTGPACTIYNVRTIAACTLFIHSKTRPSFFYIEAAEFIIGSFLINTVETVAVS
jgi:hypothetical protein